VSFVQRNRAGLDQGGCNAGVCHAKAGNGQNGFQLSLLGFEPLEDSRPSGERGTRPTAVAAAPDRSLLLMESLGPRFRMAAESDSMRPRKVSGAARMDWGQGGLMTSRRQRSSYRSKFNRLAFRQA